ncbi:MAG TPA: hypothetical protein VKZ63_09220 [Kofleriaceae bacterium]|nr:hypothetical protein [Kofleriaceae bacterium]
MLARLQQGLERLYRIETRASVEDFLIDAELRERLGVERAPREQLLVTHDEDGLSVGLFVDEEALSNLAAHDPADRLDERNLGDFLLAVEGVSHFVYLTWRAHHDHRVSALELELQAEVDKYVTCLLCEGSGEAGRSAALRRRLFEQFSFEDGLDEDERDRYRVANANAHRYSASLERRFVRVGRISGMLAELRRFYRLPLGGKLDLIRAA